MSVDDNIKLRKQNFTVKDGYFYTFDDDQDALLQKTDDGNTAFSYPCDNILTREIQSLEFDGVYFWSLESSGGDPAENILYIKRWKLENYVCKLKAIFELESSSSHFLNANCFTIEHYHTTINTTISGGSSVLYIDDYWSDVNIIPPDTTQILHLGPNENGEEEDVIMTTTVSGGVQLNEPLVYNYKDEDEVNFNKAIWLFNNNDGNDTSTGALYMYSSYNGGYMSRYAGGAYKDINACTFSKIDAFTEVGSKDMLLYTKGTNTLFVDVYGAYDPQEEGVSEEETEILSEGGDLFTGPNGSDPDDVKWTVYDNDYYISSANDSYRDSEIYIVDNTLRFEITKTQTNIDLYNPPEGQEPNQDIYGGYSDITFNYDLIGDFDVYYDCVINDMSTSLYNYYSWSFLNEIYDWSSSFGYNSQFLSVSYIWETGTHTVDRYQSETQYELSSIPHAEYFRANNTSLDVTASGGGLSNLEYSLRIKREGSTFTGYYRPVSSGIGEDWVVIDTWIGYPSEMTLSIGTKQHYKGQSVHRIDNFTFLDGGIKTTIGGTVTGGAAGVILPYIGSMVLDNIESDEFTIDHLSDMAIDRNNMYRLHDAGSTYSYNLSPLESFVTSISVSASPAIIAANGLSTTDIKAIVRDQFLQPIVGRRAVFSEDGDGSITGGTQLNTDGNGESSTVYQAGTSAQDVKFTVVVEQTS